MSTARVPASLAGVVCLAWLTLMTGYGASAAAEPHEAADLGGERVRGGTGSTSPDEPTEIGPGLWSDTLGGSATKNVHHFTYARRMKDSTVHIGVVGAPQTAESDGLKIEAGVLDAEGDVVSCGSSDDSTGYALPEALLGAAIDVGRRDAENSDRPPCLASARLQIAVSRGYGSNTAEMPIAIKVVEEAPVPGAASLPEPAEELSFSVPAEGNATELTGAWSFDEAPELDADAGGVTVSTTLTQGTEQLWRVPVQWGQQVVARATAEQGSEAELEGICCGIGMRVRLIDPRRDSFALSSGAEGESADGSYDDDEAVDMVAGSWPLLYRNRFGDEVPAVPGDVWIAVAAAPPAADAEREPLDIAVKLTVAVSGEVGGAPTYPEVVTSPSDGAGPEGYSPDEPFLVAEDTFSAVSSGNPVAAEEDEEAWLSGRRWAGLGLGAVSVACLAVGAIRLRRS